MSRQMSQQTRLFMLYHVHLKKLLNRAAKEKHCKIHVLHRIINPNHMMNFSAELTKELNMDVTENTSPKKDDFTAAENSLDHASRMKVLDGLIRSHTYALEMNRASLSASAWLKSIGRSESSSNGNAIKMVKVDDSKNSAGDGLAKSMFDSPPSQYRHPSSTDGMFGSSFMDMISMRAIMHAMELKVVEKTEQVERLNVELSNCRAEIGRLQNTSRAEVLFTAANKSILDDDDEETASSSEPSERKEDQFIMDQSIGDITPILGPNDSHLTIDPDEKSNYDEEEGKVQVSLRAAEEARKE
eukprot:367448-Ditylum_brightwellii.AAC.1